MNALIIIVLLLLSIHVASANKIDSLKTLDEVQEFLVKKIHPAFQNTFFEAYDADTTFYGNNTFHKLDFDGNGLTDMLIDGQSLFIITDDGNQQYHHHHIESLEYPNLKRTTPKIIYRNNKPLLVREGKDTLIMLFGSLIEYNPKPDTLDIEQIDFSAFGCFGPCPVFDMSIISDGRATCNFKNNNAQQGNYKAKISPPALDTLIQTLNYIKLSSLHDHYDSNFSEPASVETRITFNNGQTKNIKDDDMDGSFGLRNLYRQIFKLPITQKWRSRR